MKITRRANIIFMSGSQISNTPIGAFITGVGNGKFIDGLKFIIDNPNLGSGDANYQGWRSDVLNGKINETSEKFQTLSETLGDELATRLLHTSLEKIPELVEEYEQASEQEALESSLPTAEASGLLRDILKSAKTILAKAKQFQEIWPNLVKNKLSPLLGALKILNSEKNESEKSKGENPILNFASQEIQSVMEQASSIKKTLEPKMTELAQLGQAFSNILPADESGL